MLKKSTAVRNMLLGKFYNKITNGSFESDTNGWTAVDTTIQLANGSGYGGGNALDIAVSNASGNPNVYQEIAVVKDRQYYVEAYLKANTNMHIRLEVEDANGNNLFTSKTVTNTDWEKVYGIFIPSETGNVKIKIAPYEGLDTGEHVYADEVKCYDNAQSIKDIFTGGKIKIYTGTQPDSPDDAPSGTLLVEITGDNGGLHFEEAANGELNKKSNELWSGTATADGNAGWFRMVTPDDDDSASSDFPRIDGAVGTSGAELNMSNTYISNGSLQTISSFKITISE